MKNINLINARKEKGLTQTELANKVGRNKSSISNWENGNATPTMQVAYEISKILEKDIDHLFFDYKKS